MVAAPYFNATNKIASRGPAPFAPCTLTGYVFNLNRKYALAITCSGEGGIRTLGSRKATTVFETAPINHSGTSPTGRHPLYSKFIRQSALKVIACGQLDASALHQSQFGQRPAGHASPGWPSLGDNVENVLSKTLKAIGHIEHLCFQYLKLPWVCSGNPAQYITGQDHVRRNPQRLPGFLAPVL